MKLSPMTVGPIIRGASANQIRLWGGEENINQFPRSRRSPNVVLVGLRFVRKGRRLGLPAFFKMNPNFDMTGVVVFTGLESETCYEYQMGWCFSAKELEAKNSKVALDWGTASRAAVLTASTKSTQTRSSIFGSFRNLLLLFSRAWYDNRGDKAFRSMLN